MLFRSQEVDAKILAFSPEEKKITLSIKALEQKPETVNVKTESDRPVKARKARRSSSAASEEDEYREWNEGGYGGASIAEMLHLDEEEK